MKNHKGEIATFLTLGLVLVGSLIALGTSLLVNKNNIASNPRAASPCTHRYSDACNGTKTTSCDKHNNYIYICISSANPTTAPTGSGSSGGGESCPYNQSDAVAACRYSGGATSSGCSSGNWRCIGNGNVNPTPTSSVDSNGIPHPGEACCFYKKGLVYVFATYEARVANQMTSDCSANNVVRSYQADAGTSAFYCPNNTQNRTPTGSFVPLNNNPDGKLNGKCKIRYSSQGVAYYCASPYICDKQDGTGICKKSSAASPTPKPKCLLRQGYKCTNGIKFDYYLSTDSHCSQTYLGGNCYGTTASSCSIEWNKFKNSQCVLQSSSTSTPIPNALTPTKAQVPSKTPTPIKSPTPTTSTDELTNIPLGTCKSIISSNNINKCNVDFYRMTKNFDGIYYCCNIKSCNVGLSCSPTTINPDGTITCVDQEKRYVCDVSGNPACCNKKSSSLNNSSSNQTADNVGTTTGTINSSVVDLGGGNGLFQSSELTGVVAF